MKQDPNKIKKRNLGRRFALIVGAAVFTICAASSLALYTFLKERALQDTYEKSKIVFYLMEGVGSYVQHTLRPRMFDLLSSIKTNDTFVVEAMSTTRVKHGIMQYLEEDIPHFTYRRVSDNPRNPKNAADEFYAGMIERFAAQPELKEWQGVAKVRGVSHFFFLKPIVIKKECLRCHGDPADAPEGLIRQYGDKRGFFREEGKVAGLEAVSIPIDIVLSQVRQLAISIFGFGLGAMAFLFVAIEGTFLRLISQPLKRLSERFQEIAKGEQPLDREIPIPYMDEIGELTQSFNTLAKDLATAQDTLKSNAEVLQSIVDGISDPLALANSDCSLAVANSAYQSWIAKESPAVLGYTCHQLAHQTGIICPACLLEEVLETKKPISREWRSIDGRMYFTQLYPIFDDGGEVVQVVHYIRDITLLKQAETRMMQTEQLAAMGQLSAGVAHEINNPLSIILCYAKLLLRDMPQDTPWRDDIEVILKQAKGCSRIVDNLLSFARQDEARKSMADLNQGLREVIEMVRKQFEKDKITISEKLAQDIPRLFIDENKMKQVYLNLFMNSAQAMPDGGSITVATSFIQDKRLAEISIKDTGTGIRAEILNKIFDPFFTTKGTGQGTGLGLSVSYGIIKKHNGDIRVESAPGRGAHFIISLPLDLNHE